jgi:Immunoglobulin domain
MKKTVISSRLFKSLPLAGLLGSLALSAIAVPETDYHWSPSDVFNDGGANYAYVADGANWDSLVAPTVTNSAGSYIRTMFNQAAGSHVVAVITNNCDFYQIMVGTGGGGGGDLVITNGAVVTAGRGLDGGPTQWTGLGFPGGPSSLTIVGTGTSLSCGDHLWIGNGGSDSVGTVWIDGGTLIVQGQFGLGWNGFAGTTNYATITNGAHLQLNQWAGQTLGTATAVGILNIADNTSYVTVNGNVTGNFAAVTNNNRLIAYGGAGTVTWNYNPTLNLTTINAVGPPDQGTPLFSLQPSNAVVMLGSPVTLHSLAATPNSSPIDYTWLFNNVPLADGGGYTGTHTANLSIASVTTANTGNYAVVATNHTDITHYTLSHIAGVNAETFNLFPVITIDGVVGNTYLVQYATSLTPPVTWTTLATVTLGAASQQIVDTATPLAITRFYRVVAQ